MCVPRASATASTADWNLCNDDAVDYYVNTVLGNMVSKDGKRRNMDGCGNFNIFLDQFRISRAIFSPVLYIPGHGTPHVGR